MYNEKYRPIVQGKITGTSYSNGGTGIFFRTKMLFVFIQIQAESFSSI